MVFPKIAYKTYKIYYDKDYKCYIIDYYKNKSFPLNGWLKPCLICCQIMSNYEKYRIINTGEVLIVNICKNCVKIKDKRKYRYISELVDRVIINNYLEDIYIKSYKFEKIEVGENNNQDNINSCVCSIC